MNGRQAARASLSLLSLRDRRLLIAATAIQMSLSVLDLVGVLLIGLIGAASVSVVQSAPLPETIVQAAGLFGLNFDSPQQFVAVFALIAAVLLLGKSALSLLLLRRLLKFLANRQAIVSADLAERFLRKDLLFVQTRASQEAAYAITSGAGAATVGVLGTTVIILSESSLLALLAVALFVLDPWISLASVAFFALVGFMLQRILGGWAARLSELMARTDISSTAAIQEAISAFREVVVLNRREYVTANIQDLRWRAAEALAGRELIGQVPKFAFEVALVVGGLALAAVLFSTRDASAAIGTLALFLAAASRVMPSLLRMQGAAIGLRSASGAAQPTFQLHTELGASHDFVSPRAEISHRSVPPADHWGEQDFVPEVSLDHVSVSYPGAEKPALDRVSLVVEAGTSTALVGTSGAGKSTLADILLGLLVPSSGSVTISGLAPSDALKRWPGCVGYVPQEAVMVQGNVRDNVAFGLPANEVDDDAVWVALQKAAIADFVAAAPEGLELPVGERGTKLSGGQRQRFGIARALYSDPKLLILDEATSALDSQTESAINDMVLRMGGSVTVVIIAHRLSTVLAADKVAYLHEGRIEAVGSFEEVRASVADFDQQARLMGIE